LLRVGLGDRLCTGRVILRMRSELCSLHNKKKRYFAPKTWLNLRRSAPKETKCTLVAKIVDTLWNFIDVIRQPMVSVTYL